MAETWTIKDLLEWTARYFAGKGIEAARLEAELLLAHALQKSRVSLYTDYDAPVGSAERAAFRGLIARRAQGEPLAYITGSREFMSLDFLVGSGVLIPRPETEILVEEAIKAAAAWESPRICDVGCGSGAIAVSLAHYLPGARVRALDISPQALEIARTNASRHQVEIEFFTSDLLGDLPPELAFDIIAANLPYVSAADYSRLNRSVAAYEPALALKGGADGLDPYRALLPQAIPRLSPGGWLFMEIDPAQAALLEGIIRQCNEWEAFQVINDLAGRERVVKVRRKSL